MGQSLRLLIGALLCSGLAMAADNLTDALIRPSVAGASAGSTSVNLLENPGFESGFSPKGLATGWADDSGWAQVKVVYSEDTENPHGGRFAQRMECSEFTKGAVNLRATVALEKGKIHTVSAWLRAKETTPVDVYLRKKGKPYNTYAIRSVKVGTAWQEVRFSEMISTEDPDAALMITLKQVATLWVDDVAVVPADKKGWGPMTFSPPAGPIPPGLFGLHYLPYHFHKGETVKDSRPWPEVSFKTLRLWDSDVSWNWLERKKGEWNWKVLDNFVALSALKGVDLILPLALSPTWASARPEEKPIYGKYWMGCAAEPRDMDDWRNYVRTVVTRYKGKIKYYEGWNEPDIGGFYSGTKAKLVELQKEMFRIVKEVDPAAKVISPSAAAAGVGYLEGLFDLGLSQWCDAIGFHFYTGAGGPENALTKMGLIRDMMKKYGSGDKPLLNTEAGWSIESSLTPPKADTGVDTEKTISMEKAGAYVARGFVLNWVMGIPMWCLYRWEGSMGLREDNNELKITALAYRNMAAWLTGAVMISCARDWEGTYTVVLNRSGKTTTIAWNADASVSFPVPLNTVKIKDVFGKDLDAKSKTLILGETPVRME